MNQAFEALDVTRGEAWPLVKRKTTYCFTGTFFNHEHSVKPGFTHAAKKETITVVLTKPIGNPRCRSDSYGRCWYSLASGGSNTRVFICALELGIVNIPQWGACSWPASLGRAEGATSLAGSPIVAEFLKHVGSSLTVGMAA